ncbi:DUF262 domain-containing protein [Geitlerinema sp. PCC 7407]|uniref:GmrSD restriction endonuclease domain-containing protein n=1 Tax=Geitlerinema sp. PCC 7407 TaxID=1173025 RepID=UPI00029FD238|nr:DUF262 domain-containing protein [Geitlerinema sp. PCC 7407]AFY67260.1 Protein of unknown function DUF2081 [Geitlerinema sp. PCC 7407]
MNTPISAFDLSKEALPDLLLKIQQGFIQLPDLQRSFCWHDDLVIDLLASVSQGWPIGGILLQEVCNGSWKVCSRLVEGVQLEQVPIPTELILDGQQRCTTLFMCLFSNRPVRVQSRRNGKMSDRWYYVDIQKALDPDVEREQSILGFNNRRIRPGFAGHPAINCSSPEQEYELGLFPLAQVFSYAAWRQGYSKYWQYDPVKLELLDRFEREVIKRFEHFQVPVIRLKPGLPKTAICRVFEKVNTQSEQLNFFDLATACFASQDFSLRDDWAKREDRLKQHRVLQTVKETDYIACVALVATYHQRQQAIAAGNPTQQLPAVACSREEVLDLSLADYQKYADQVVAGYEEAARFLYGQKIQTAENLPYQIQLVALAAILAVVGYPQDRVRAKLEQWFWCGSCAALYTSWHERRASRDMVEVPIWLNGGGELPNTVQMAHLQAERLLLVRRRHGAVYKAINALLRKNGAIDFAAGEALAEINLFNDPIDSHHIFPVAYCKKQGIDKDRYNSLVNLTPLSRLSNQKIGGKAPSQYLRVLEAEGISRRRMDEILRSHLIEPETLRADDFESFLSKRAYALMDLVNRAMGKTSTGGLMEIAANPTSKRASA